MEVTSTRLQEIKSILQYYNQTNEFAKFKLKGEEALMAEELLKFTYASKVQCRKGMSISPRLEKEHLDNCVRWMTDPSYKMSLVLYGNPGTGKTTYMSSMYDVYRQIYQYEPKYTFKYYKATQLGNIMKNSHDEFQSILNSTVLFIDDLGFNGESELINDWGVKRKPIVDILEHRYDKMRATCCTTNLNTKEIREIYGERLYSRIMEQFAFIAVTGIDHRLEKY